MINSKTILTLLFIGLLSFVQAQEAPLTFNNPILTGFHPDPSVCRVGDDYYMVNSSFTWFPGLPIYHSKDLVNWTLIGHGITSAEQLNFDGLEDKYGIWAPTIRYHNGLFYVITTCSSCGGNFYITAKNPAEDWSDPIWLKDAEGIDPSLFWDDDGTCYYTGNYWNFKKSWSGQCAIWAQELDLENQQLIGEKKILTYGHANNAGYTEAPHIYKIDGRYVLITAEGGTNEYHAVSSHHSSTVLGKYTSDKINPVLTHRNLGNNYPIQAVGHADLVQTQHADWWAVVLGKRMIDGDNPLARETFLCKVDFQEQTPLFNIGHSKVLLEQERPNLPWTPNTKPSFKDDFNSEQLDLNWYTIKTPKQAYFKVNNGILNLQLQPQVADSLTHASLLIQKTKHFKYTATTKISFNTKKDNEQAGLIVYRTNNSYYALLKEKHQVVLIKKFDNQKTIIDSFPTSQKEIYLRVAVNKLDIQFSLGYTLKTMQNIGEVQSMSILTDNRINKFNGTGVGIYATSNGKKTKNKARFDWFEYKY